MKLKVEPATVILIFLYMLAFAGGFGAGYAAKTTEDNTYVTEYVTQNQTQEQWQAQIGVTVIDSAFRSNVSIQLKDLTNITVNVETNFLTNKE